MDLPPILLLDLDDTIVAYDAIMEPVWRSVCGRFAPRAEGCTAEAIYEAIDAYSAWYWSDAERHRLGRLDLIGARREVVTEALRRIGCHDEQLARDIADTYSFEREEAVVPFPGALETLQGFVDRGVRLALLTNGAIRTQRAKIERHGLAKFFECIVVEEEFGCGKPDERVFLHALETLGAPPSDAWMVGDNLEWDVAAPQRLGIRGVWNDWRRRGLPAGCAVRPFRIVHEIGDLLK